MEEVGGGRRRRREKEGGGGGRRRREQWEGGVGGRSRRVGREEAGGFDCCKLPVMSVHRLANVLTPICTKRRCCNGNAARQRRISSIDILYVFEALSSWGRIRMQQTSPPPISQPQEVCSNRPPSSSQPQEVCSNRTLLLPPSLPSSSSLLLLPPSPSSSSFLLLPPPFHFSISQFSIDLGSSFGTFHFSIFPFFHRFWK